MQKPITISNMDVLSIILPGAHVKAGLKQTREPMSSNDVEQGAATRLEWIILLSVAKPNPRTPTAIAETAA